MRSRFAAVVLTVAALAGCSSADATSSELDLRAACDELAAVQAEFGEVQPDAARFDEYAPKVRAIMDRADAQASEVLEPLAAAMEGGDVFELAGVTIGIQGVCTGAGSTAWA